MPYHLDGSRLLGETDFFLAGLVKWGRSAGLVVTSSSSSSAITSLNI